MGNRVGSCSKIAIDITEMMMMYNVEDGTSVQEVELVRLKKLLKLLLNKNKLDQRSKDNLISIIRKEVEFSDDVREDALKV